MLKVDHSRVQKLLSNGKKLLKKARLSPKKKAMDDAVSGYRSVDAYTRPLRYHAPHPRSSVDGIRKRLAKDARDANVTTEAMTDAEKIAAFKAQTKYVEKIEQQAIAEQARLKKLIGGTTDKTKKARLELDLERAKKLEQAAQVKLVQGRLPINHQFAGREFGSGDLDNVIASARKKLDDPTTTPKARKEAQSTLNKASEAKGVLKKEGLTGVKFNKDGYPDFTPFTYKKKGVTADVEIKFTGNRKSDDRLARNKMRELLEDSTWKKPAGYTWHHHHDGRRMVLVKTAIHDAVKHTGGAAKHRVNTGDLSAYAKNN